MKIKPAFLALAWAFLGSASLLHALGPDSLVGKVYRQTGAIASIRRVWEYTVVFTTETRFVFVKSASGSPLANGAPNQVYLETTSDGTYTYRRLSDTTASFDLTFDDGRLKLSQPLTFVTASDGTVELARSATEEIFSSLSDLGDAKQVPAANISLRNRVTPDHPLIAGFVVPGPILPENGQIVPASGSRPREVLIRVVGPSLAQFGVTGFWADPDFTLYRGSSPAVVFSVHYADWSTPPTGSINGAPLPTSPDPVTDAAFRKIFTFAGAFPLASGSKDAAAVHRLKPGAYTIVCNTAPGDAGGEALIEVYFLP